MKALIIHSSSKILNYSINYLKEQNYTIDILTNSENIKKENFENKINQIIYFSIPSYNIKFLKAVKDKLYNYDLIAVLYNIKGGLSYSNVDKLALELKPQKVIGIDIHKNIYKVDKLSLQTKIKRERGKFFMNYLANKPLTLIIMLLLLLLIPLTDFIFKIYQITKKRFF